jgi:hypothetical protein
MALLDPSHIAATGGTCAIGERFLSAAALRGTIGLLSSLVCISVAIICTIISISIQRIAGCSLDLQSEHLLAIDHMH